MRELKIFFVVVFFTGLVYWGVEPYAHSVMNPPSTPVNFDFAKADEEFIKNEVALKEKALLDANVSGGEKAIINAQKALELAKNQEEATKQIWEKIAKIDFAKGNAKKGKELFEGNCIACHGIEAAGIPATITDSSLGVTPPDLSDAGAIYDEKFLAALIIDPVKALQISHKFNDEKPFLMPAYPLSGDEVQDNQDLADLIAFFKNTANEYEKEFDVKLKAELEEKYAKNQELTQQQKSALIAKEFEFAKDKNTFINACGRCHDVKYDNFTSSSNINDLKNYLGSNPPDLSMMIRSKGEHYLEIFINEPQKKLYGTAMPRVGLNEKAQTQVISYLEKVGDSKKEEREQTGIYIMVFFAILSIFAIGWKRSVWSKLH
ncbi:c-type cytochrome [Campylobacter armoricus]|uniref:Ubiquinol cytochrome c oxidoreductase PetABC, membrane-bound cytochrome c subunit n=1 Tax=Campylobacter armoricus TaxID=2505970 RepID=A0A7L5HYI2_9BACT|nr:c-type cytochrome [Campylobacter armoricus]QKF80016.1 ubiquinol cytochrome c oxidoreductase PetABC, membrane-bound cytochrome c subunit [Campylobacter armoricus]